MGFPAASLTSIDPFYTTHRNATQRTLDPTKGGAFAHVEYFSLFREREFLWLFGVTVPGFRKTGMLFQRLDVAAVVGTQCPMN